MLKFEGKEMRLVSQKPNVEPPITDSNWFPVVRGTFMDKLARDYIPSLSFRESLRRFKFEVWVEVWQRM